MGNVRKTVKPSLVIASTTTDLPKSLELASYSCNSCSHEFVANAKMSPFCVHCGSEEVEMRPDVDIDVDDDLENEEELSALKCPECNTTNIITDKMVLSFAGHIHCSACGTELSYEDPTTSGDPDFDSSDLFADEDENLDTSDDIIADSTMFDDESKDMKDTEETLNPDILPTEPMASEEVPLIDMVDGEEASRDKQCSFVALSPNTILAFVRDVCVARSDRRDDQVHASIFGTSPHLKAMYASLQANGLDSTLKDFNFALTKVKVQSSVLKKKAIAKAANEERAKIRKELVSSVSTLRQCLGIAAAGLNKNFFKGKGHPLKASLFEALAAAGVRKPERIIDSVFSSTNDAYHRTLIETAMELTDKPVTLRNSIAEAIGDSNYVPVSDDEDKDVSDSTSEMEDRLEKSLTPATEISSVDSSRSISRGKLFSIR